MHNSISRKSSCIVGSGRTLLVLYVEQHPDMAAYVCLHRVNGEHQVRVIDGAYGSYVAIAHDFCIAVCEYIPLPSLSNNSPA